jgi:predicted small secreted protein
MRTIQTTVSTVLLAALLAACSGGNGIGSSDNTASSAENTSNAVLDSAFTTKVNGICQNGITAGAAGQKQSITSLLALPAPATGKATWTTITGELKDLQNATADTRADVLNRLGSGLFNAGLIDGPCGDLFR